MNLQMFKLASQKAEESEIKLPTSAGSSKKQEFQEILRTGGNNTEKNYTK